MDYPPVRGYSPSLLAFHKSLKTGYVLEHRALNGLKAPFLGFTISLLTISAAVCIYLFLDVFIVFIVLNIVLKLWQPNNLAS